MSEVAFETVEDLPVNVAVLDAAGIIVRVNGRWRQFGRDNGLAAPEFGLGADYLDLCERAMGRDAKLVQDLRALLSGDLRVLTFAYPCHSDSERRWFMLLGLPVGNGRSLGAALVHINITALVPGLAFGDETKPSSVRVDGHAEPSRTVPIVELVSAAVERSLEKLLGSALARNGRHHVPQVSEPAGTDASEAYERVGRILSKRQMEVLALIGEGKSNAEITRALGISQNTVKLHVSAILKKLQLSSRTQAALLAANLREPRP